MILLPTASGEVPEGGICWAMHNEWAEAAARYERSEGFRRWMSSPSCMRILSYLETNKVHQCVRVKSDCAQFARQTTLAEVPCLFGLGRSWDVVDVCNTARLAARVRGMSLDRVQKIRLCDWSSEYCAS